jgi:hypothetical protein
MAKNPTRFAEQATEEAMQGTMQGTIYGMKWMREIAEQNLDQTRMLLENLLAITRKAIDDIDHQSSEFHQRSLLVAEETLSNTFDFVHKLVRAREPRELAQLQTEFASRQAQTIVDQSKELVHKANEMTKTTTQVAAEASRGRFEAA